MTETLPAKPVARLSDTDWLTDARDAEPGMQIVWARPGEPRERAEIVEVIRTDGETVLRTPDRNGSAHAVTAESINRSRHAVVE
jgi:hypothetical protein